MAEHVGYRVVGTIKAVKGFCHAGHKEGDHLELDAHKPGGLCGFLYHDVFPYLLMLQFGGGFSLSLIIVRDFGLLSKLESTRKVFSF